MNQGDEHEDQAQVDVREHEKTFEGFLRVAALVGIVSIVILIFLAVVGT